MRLWHNTEDAPRLPETVVEGKRVEVWIASYPIAPWHHVMVDWKVTHCNGRVESGSVPAFWKYNDFLLGEIHWLAILGPFLQGDRVEYAVVGMSAVETLSPRAYAFSVEQQKRKVNMVKDPVCGMNIEEAAAAGTCEYEGNKFFFCAPSCKQTFEMHPPKFLGEQNRIHEVMRKPLTNELGAMPKYTYQTQKGEQS